ncbi:MAG: patatin-like phospholipase family protein [Methylococcales bacterium]|nr:patatin-like phospholipase family protein [Methylococcales bacterium]
MNKFNKVLKEEQDIINESRKHNARSGTSQVDGDYVGLAFSGGGIRSATFNFGVLKALADLKILKHFDYLSTVSGGGYIGSWLTAYLHNHHHDINSTNNIDKIIANACQETASKPNESMWFLRSYSNYLTPNLSMFNADTWTVFSTYMRNWILNLTLLFFFLTSLLLFVHLTEIFGINFIKNLGSYRGLGGFVSLISFLAAGYFAFKSVKDDKETDNNLPFDKKDGNNFCLYCIACVVSGALFGSFFLLSGNLEKSSAILPQSPVLIVALLFVLVGIFFYIGLRSESSAINSSETIKIKKNNIELLSRFGAGLWILTVIWLVAFIFYKPSAISEINIAHGVIWTPPLLIIIVMLSVVFYIGFGSKTFIDSPKLEWFSRLGAWLLIFIAGWASAFLLAFYSPLLVNEIHGWLRNTISLAWILQSGAGLLAAQSSKTTSSVGKQTNKALEIFLKVSPYIFVIGIFFFIANLLVKFFYSSCNQDYFYCLNNLENNDITIRLVYAFFICLAMTLSLGLVLDINKLSIHYFYRNRLIRCYLGGARKGDRNPNVFTGFDEKDNIQLNELLKKDTTGKEYIDGLYPIINGTLNLVAGKQLAWQQRKGASFIFSPKYCGYSIRETNKKSDDGQRHCYQETKKDNFKYGDGVSLGMAMAISGAAASPNSGYHSSPAMSFLMTVFNVRLGQWLPNSDVARNRVRPMFPLWYLLLELFGQTNEDRDFIYLSDGGHFENLGIYELVHRGCRFILASDAEQDGAFSFEGLGNAIEKCRIDLGVNISIDVEQIRPDANNKSKCHCAVATIEYSKNSQTDSHNKRIYPEEDGILVYLKSSLTGDESTDVLHYSLQNPDFPHESTADQWFSESQFESYRQLGEHICKETFETFGALDSTKSIEGIFIDLQNRWYPLPIGFDAFTKHTRTLDKLLERLRKDHDLAFLDAELCGEMWDKIVAGELGLTFPNSSHTHPANYSEFHNAFYFCNSLIQLMENVFLELNFEVDEYFKHPHNEGWRNLFKLWAKAPTVQKTWEINKLTYSKRFREFAEGKAMGINSPRS